MLNYSTYRIVSDNLLASLMNDKFIKIIDSSQDQLKNLLAYIDGTLNIIVNENQLYKTVN